MYFVISFNYRNSSVELRGRLAKLTLEDFRDFKEVLLVSTCNRFELIFDKKPSLEKLYKVFSPFISKEEFELAEMYEKEEAIAHIFKLASSLDSMVVGETQITGQLKEAFLKAYEKNYAGKNITRLMHFSFKCAKKIRNKTQISSEPVSVASIAVRLAKEKLNDLSGFSAVVVGVGDTAKIVCKNLVKEGVNIILVNRTIENAISLKEELGDEVNIDVHSLDMLPKLVNNYRLLFSATSATYPVITKEFVKDTKFKRVWFDLAIPSDIEEISCKDIEVIKVDDLQELSEKNMKKREKEINKAQEIIKECVKEFYDYLSSVSIEPTIKFLNEKAKECAVDALNNAVKKGFIPKELEKEVEKVLENAFKRFLHNPNKTLKKMSNSAEADIFVSVIKRLFNDESVKMDMNKCEYHLEKGILHKG